MEVDAAKYHMKSYFANRPKRQGSENAAQLQRSEVCREMSGEVLAASDQGSTPRLCMRQNRLLENLKRCVFHTISSRLHQTQIVAIPHSQSYH